MQNKSKKGNNSKAVPIAIVLVIIAVLAAGLYIFIGKQDEKPQTVGVELYFVEGETNQLKSEIHEINEGSNEEIVSQVLTELKKGPKTETFMPSIPNDVNILQAKISNSLVTVDVSSEYLNIKAGEELLCRASLVWTLTSLDFIDRVKITVEGEELKQTNGQPMGEMKQDDIVLDAVISPEPSNYETVKLYFSDEQATTLEVEERTVEVNPNQLERYIIEQLISGPVSKNLLPTVPPETQIRNVETVDGICYVDLSSEFVTKNNVGSAGEALTIYSIVNSLTELDKVKKVQFLIDGEKQAEYKGHIDFSKPFEAKKDINV